MTFIVRWKVHVCVLESSERAMILGRATFRASVKKKKKIAN